MDNELLSGASQAKVTLVEAVLTVLRFVGAGRTVKEGYIISVTVIIKITIIIDDVDSCF